VLVSAWQDSAVVKFATTIHTGKEWTNRERKKPRDSVIDARFGSYRQKLQIGATAIVGSYGRRLTVPGQELVYGRKPRS